MYNIINTDLLVLGGGGAGLRAAIYGAEEGLNVLCLSKGPIGRSGITPVAGEGIEAPMNPEDSPEEFFKDTVAAGRNLADESLVRPMAEEAVERILDIEKYGGKYKKDEEGNFIQSPRPGQTHARNCYIKGGGWGLMHALFKKAGSFENLKIWTDTLAIKLLMDEDKVTGALVLDIRTGVIHTVLAKNTIISTGGYEELWPITDTPPESTGEGIVLAYQAGAKLVDLEMLLYYPTIFIYPLAARGFLLQYEYIMNPDILDGRLLNGNKEEFIEGFPLRDEIIRKVYEEVNAGRGTPHGGIYLDLSKSRFGKEELTEKLKEWVPVQYSNLKALDIDIREELTEMAPAAHYCLGGININPDGETGVEGLFAAGEVAGNVHGANRLSGNALTETQVFGFRAAQAAKNKSQVAPKIKPQYNAQWTEEVDRIKEFATPKKDSISPRKAKNMLQDIMWKYMGPSRDEEGMNKGLKELEDLKTEVERKLTVQPINRYCYEIREAYEVIFMLDLAKLTLLSALERKESRGHHHRRDYLMTDDNPYHTTVQLSKDKPIVSRMSVKKEVK